MRHRAVMLTTFFILAAGISSLRASIALKPPAGPIRIEVIPGNSALVIGNTQQMIAVLESFRGFQQSQKLRPVTATWTSSNPGIASIDPATGIVAAVAKGVVQITARSGPFHGFTFLTVTPQLNSITVTPANQAIPEGAPLQFTATGNYSDASTADLTAQATWSSTDQTIATIAPGGQAVASNVNTGGTTIRATYDAGTGPITGSTNLTVGPAALVSISVTPLNPTVPKGTPQQFTATGTYTNNAQIDITNSVTWASSDMTKATIGNTGLAATLAQGSTTISAALGGKTGASTLTIGPAVVNQVQVSPHGAGTIALGNTFQFTATAYFTDGSTLDVTGNGGTSWSSNNQAVATVSQGLVTSQSQGNNVQITASYSGFNDMGTISVGPPALKSIAVTPSPVTIANGLTQQFTATGTYTDNSTQDLTNSATWSVNNPSVISVNNTGLGTCKQVGDGSQVSAASGIVNGSATLNCGPPNLTSITVTPANSTIANGTNQNMVATGHYTDNTTQNLTGLAAWSSSNTAIATIVNIPGLGTNGQVTGKTQGGPVTITASYNSVNGTTNLTVGPPNLVSIAVTPASPIVSKGNTQQFTATGTYTDNSTQNLTNTATWSSSTGVVGTINASTGLATAVSIGTTTITATQSSISGNTNMRVIGPPSRFAYTANFSDNTIEEYTIGGNGQLRDNGYVFNGVGAGPQGITVDPGNNYLYVTNSNLNTVSAYTITANGTLAPISGSPFASGTTLTSGPSAVAVSYRGNGGKSAYAANFGENTVTAFTIANNGALTSPSTQAVGTSPIGVVATSDGLNVYVSNSGGAPGTISEFSVSQNTGLLTPNGTINAGTSPENMAVDPFNRFLFVANTGSNNVTSYQISGINGTLSNPNITAAGNGTLALAVDPSGHFAYAVNYLGNTVSEYTINQSTGQLTAINGNASIASGADPQAVSVDSTGQYVYVGHFSADEVWQYSINAGTGALTFLRKIRSGKAVDGMAITAGATPQYFDFLAFDVNSAGVGESSANANTGALGAFTNFAPVSPSAVTVDPYERFVYTAKGTNNTVEQYSLVSCGFFCLTLHDNGSASTGNFPFNLTVDPSGRFLYVAANAGVFGFTINQSTGVLTAISGGAALGVSGNLTQITTDPTGRFLFVGSNGPPEVSVYTINPATGVLTTVAGSPFSTIVGNAIAVDPTGRFLYVAGGSFGTDRILVCPITAATGVISCSVTVATAAFAIGIAVEPTGQYAYATFLDGTAAAYSIDSNSGGLSIIGSPVAAGNSPNSVAVDYQGQFVYVTNSGANTISGYSINPNTGALTEITGAGSPFAAGTNPGSVVISGIIQ
ncbi:MAG TPA: Ig-like domain-containing protein [Terriglobales bacterium]|jgi:6-phosphogluconolactonase (cycloisomerase 2 family)|nr:Ig-like domain-containing protein [Terriglobales bacterium]